MLALGHYLNRAVGCLKQRAVERAATARTLSLNSGLTVGQHLKIGSIVNWATFGQLVVLFPRAGLYVDVAIHHIVNTSVHVDVLQQLLLLDNKSLFHVLNELASEEAL